MSVITAKEVCVEDVVDKLFAYMEEQGYEARAPGNKAERLEIERMDRQIFESGCCLKCGCGDVRFYPFFRANPHSYLSWVVCTRCGNEKEV